MDDFGEFSKFRKLKGAHLEIIEELAKNPRLSNKEIAKNLGKTKGAIDNDLTDIYELREIDGKPGEKKRQLIQEIKNETRKKATLDELYRTPVKKEVKPKPTQKKKRIRQRVKPSSPFPTPEPIVVEILPLTEPPKSDHPPPEARDRSPPPGMPRARITTPQMYGPPSGPVEVPGRGIRGQLLIVVLTIFLAFVMGLAVNGRRDVNGANQPTPGRPETPVLGTSPLLVMTFTATSVTPSKTPAITPTPTKAKIKRKPTPTPTAKKKKKSVKHPTDTPTFVPTPYIPPYP